jgi:hypothetical protein
LLGQLFKSDYRYYSCAAAWQQHPVISAVLTNLLEANATQVDCVDFFGSLHSLGKMTNNAIAADNASDTEHNQWING